MYDFDSDVAEKQPHFCLQNMSKQDKGLRFATLRCKAIFIDLKYVILINVKYLSEIFIVINCNNVAFIVTLGLVR